MPSLILIKHSLPEIVPGVPASQWRLSEEGHRRCHALARQLAAYQPQVLVSSVEPKAVETAQIVGADLGLSVETAEGLHEHERDNVGFLGNEAFEASVKAFFERPEELVFGSETADEAHTRFAAALSLVLQRHPGVPVAAVAHGTVISLFVARATRIEPFPLWKRLGLPSYVVLSLPEFRLDSVVERC
ncbi:MAG TPA: histidine phosphatase family protein [Ardenticatenaceae bacterium]|nr:histidine phosphatase family protein [Ardenticatenaceae bacterium]